MCPSRETNDQDLLPRFRGAVLGAAVADALAFPYQHYSRSFLSSLAHPLGSEFVAPSTGFHPAGQYGYATQVLLATLASIAEAGGVSGESLADHMIRLWRENLLVTREPSTTEVIERIAKGLAAWSDAGLGPGRAEAAPVVRSVAVGLWDHADFERLAQDTGIATRITHRDPRPAACAAAVAAAVASNIQTEELYLGVFLDRAAAAAGRYDSVIRDALLDFPRVLSQSEPRALRHLTALCADSKYTHSDDGLGDYCVPAVFTALYYFLRSPYNYGKAVEGCLRLGGHIDIAAFVGGALSGALLGDTGIPPELAGGLLNGQEISRSADDLHEARLKK